MFGKIISKIKEKIEALKPTGRKRGAFGNILYYVVLILVGTLVAYHVVSELVNQMTNVTGLWAVVKTLAPIIVPVFFIMALVGLLGRGK